MGPRGRCAVPAMSVQKPRQDTRERREPWCVIVRHRETVEYLRFRDRPEANKIYRQLRHSGYTLYPRSQS